MTLKCTLLPKFWNETNTTLTKRNQQNNIKAINFSLLYSVTEYKSQPNKLWDFIRKKSNKELCMYNEVIIIMNISLLMYSL